MVQSTEKKVMKSNVIAAFSFQKCHRFCKFQLRTLTWFLAMISSIKELRAFRDRLFWTKTSTSSSGFSTFMFHLIKRICRKKKKGKKYCHRCVRLSQPRRVAKNNCASKLIIDASAHAMLTTIFTQFWRKKTRNLRQFFWRVDVEVRASHILHISLEKTS